MKGQKSGQYNGKPARMHPTISFGDQPQFYPTFALDFSGNCHWILIRLFTKGIEDTEQGRILHLSCIDLYVGGDMGCKLSHVISQIQDFWEKLELTQTLLVQKWPEWGRTLAEVAIVK